MPFSFIMSMMKERVLPIECLGMSVVSMQILQDVKERCRAAVRQRSCIIDPTYCSNGT